MSRYHIIILMIITALTMPACSSAKEKKQPTVQEPVVAGVFYPANPIMLRGVIKKYLKEAQEKELKGHLMGLVAPHAGYRFSGAVAAYSFKQLVGRKYKTIVVMSPSHRMPLRGGAVSVRDVYRTPLGDIPMAKDVLENMIKNNPLFEDDQRPYQMEHALEVELPFLQTVQKDFKLVPIIVGTHDKAKLDSMAETLNTLLPGEDVLFVASTDLSHYKPYDQAVKADKQTISFIEKGNPEKFWEAEEDGRVLACGAAPMYMVMKLWKMRGGERIELLQYLNSGDTAGDKSKVVGYAALALLTKSGTEYESKEDKSSFSLTAEQKDELLKLARETVVAHVRKKELPSIKTRDRLLKRNGASFVTLKKNGQLRGCIGHIVAREPLIENVRNMAVAASSSDPRFPPVRSGELKDIHVEVSVLTPPQILPNPMDVNVGEDGLIIERGFNRGVLLPQVPTEQGWNKDEYLRGICRKAGMEPTCWKAAKLEKFQAIVFGE